MTWKDFKEWAEGRGIKDADEIRYIDFVREPNELYRDAWGKVEIE